MLAGDTVVTEGSVNDGLVLGGAFLLVFGHVLCLSLLLRDGAVI